MSQALYDFAIVSAIACHHRHCDAAAPPTSVWSSLSSLPWAALALTSARGSNKYETILG